MQYQQIYFVVQGDVNKYGSVLSYFSILDNIDLKIVHLNDVQPEAGDIFYQPLFFTYGESFDYLIEKVGENNVGLPLVYDRLSAEKWVDTLQCDHDAVLWFAHGSSHLKTLEMYTIIESIMIQKYGAFHRLLTLKTDPETLRTYCDLLKQNKITTLEVQPLLMTLGHHYHNDIQNRIMPLIALMGVRPQVKEECLIEKKQIMELFYQRLF